MGKRHDFYCRAREGHVADVLVALLVHLDSSQADVGVMGEFRLRQAERFSPCARSGRMALI